jgi:uncharacterized protein (TIGR03437 family)
MTFAQPAAGQSSIRVVNAGSLLSDDLAPNTMISIIGSNLATSTMPSPDVLHPYTVLNGVTVKVGGVPAGLLYISSGQINAVIDPSTPPGPATVTVQSPTVNASASVNIRPTVAPALFAAAGAGSRDGAILNAVTFAAGPFTVTTGGGPTYLALYLTGLDLTTAPTVTIGGLPATVQFYGNAPCCAGLEQINVQVPSSLAGTGRIDLVVTSGGQSSNAVETVILPSPGQGPFAPSAENTPRAREIGAIAYVPALGVTLVLDEQDDVIRVIDMKQRAVTRTIALASGAQPFAIAVNDAGSQAIVAERGRGKAAFIDLARGYVISEIPVDPGPSAVAINGDLALVASEDTDTVSVISVVLRQVLATIPVGRSPRSVAIDDTSGRAWVVNQNSGSISVIDLARRAVVDTIPVGANARPETARLLPGGSMLAVTEPVAGVVDFFDVTSKAKFTSRAVASDLAFQQSNVYLANPIGAAAMFAPVNLGGGGVALGTPSTINLDPGLRSVAIDTLDNLALVSSESSGTVSLIDLTSQRVAGSVNAVRSESESAARNDRSDRDHAANTPMVTSILPAQAAAGSTVQLTVNVSDSFGAFDVFFAGPGGAGRDSSLNVTAMDVDPSGGQVRITVQIAPGAVKGNHLLRVFTPNGESGTTASAANVLTVQ